MRGDQFERDVMRVVTNGNCSGCGACALISPRVTMRDVDGFLRPRVEGDVPSGPGERRFREVCPGVGLRRQASEAMAHPVFGRCVSAWEAAAVDPEIRRAGSSGGVLTALESWLLTSGVVAEVRAAAADRARPTRTVPGTISSREEALRASGSRYAPVATASGLRDVSAPYVFVGKPCEASAVQKASLGPQALRPAEVVLSFFCASTPRQTATDALVADLGMQPGRVADLRYRGDGWPGEFRVRSDDGHTESLTYEESWGARLGRDLQWRCKLCVDGTGEDADIAVGDFWRSDDRGFPIFEEGQGNSVAIARTAKGHALLLRAQA
jgi:coenzyme F420 hydrogenase subunit beta